VYERAAESLRYEPISRKDAEVKAFLKAEKINFSAKVDPAPRVIQPRDPRYNVEVGRYLKVFEHTVYDGYEKTFGYPVMLKGRNATQQATAFRESWDSFVDPVAVGLDASRFDQHVSVDALKFEHRFYNAKFQSAELRELLKWQLFTKGIGRAKDGHVRYTVHGSRMSGDMNTALGNCIIMASIVLAYFEHVGIEARLHNNGDDCTVICERKNFHLMSGIDQWFTEFGFKLTQEPVVDVFERIEFCQTHPVWTESGWRMVRNPFTAMSKDCVSMLSWDNELEFQRWRNAIGTCGMQLTSGVPMWYDWYKKLWAPQAAEYATQSALETGMGYLSVGVKGCEVSEDSRYSFYLAFGILPDDQVAFEESVPEVCWFEPGPVSNFAAITPINRLLEKYDQKEQPSIQQSSGSTSGGGRA